MQLPTTSTGISPATLMFGRNLQTTLPQLAFNRDRSDPRETDKLAKEKMSAYADCKSQVKPSLLEVGNPVLIKHEGVKKSCPPFNSKLLVITARRGTIHHQKQLEIQIIPGAPR